MGIKYKNHSTSSGIYRITIGSRFYYGRASKFLSRKSGHKRLLEQGRHPNIIMQRCYNKHGLQDGWFEIIELCDKSDLEAVEQRYLDKWVSHPKCMNIAKNSTAPTEGMTFSEETCRRRAEISRNKFTEENLRKMVEGRRKVGWVSPSADTRRKISEANTGMRRWSVPVTLRMPDGTVIDFEAAADAAEHVGCSRAQMTLWLRGDTKWPGQGKWSNKFGHLAGLRGWYTDGPWEEVREVLRERREQKEAERKWYLDNGE